MKFIDAYVHLSDKGYTEDADELITEAKIPTLPFWASNSNGEVLNF